VLASAWKACGESVCLAFAQRQIVPQRSAVARKFILSYRAFTQGRQSARAVDIVERQIRQRAKSAPHLLAVLERAYQALNRAADARRAATNQTELNAEERWQETAGQRGTRR